MNIKQYEYLQSLSVKQFNAKASAVPPTRSHRSKDYRHSEETRKKISEANKGRNSPCGFAGRTHTTETREVLSKISKGLIRSEKTRKKMSANNKMKKSVRTPLGDFGSMKEAAQAHGFNTGEPIRRSIRRGVDGYSYRLKDNFQLRAI